MLASHCSLHSRVCHKNKTFFFLFQYHIRVIANVPPNLLAYGARCKQSLFKPEIKEIFGSLVLDPNDFVSQSNFDICIPAACILSIFAQCTATKNYDLTKNQFQTGLNALSFHSVFDICKLNDGFTLEDIRTIEKLNSPPSPKLVELFPVMNNYSGIAINIFRAQITTHDRKTNLHLFPTILSQQHKSKNHLQIDLLRDSSQLRLPTYTKTKLNHVLTITNITKLLARRTGKSKHAGEFTATCRACRSIFRDQNDFFCHSTNSCCNFAVGGKCQKRRAKNKKIHRPYVFDHKSGKVRKNGIVFKRSKNFQTLKPLCLTFLDLETIPHPVNQPPVRNPQPSSNIPPPQTMRFLAYQSLVTVIKLFLFTLTIKYPNLYKNHVLLYMTQQRRVKPIFF